MRQRQNTGLTAEDEAMIAKFKEKFGTEEIRKEHVENYIAQLTNRELNTLPTCVNDAVLWISMLLSDYSIPSANNFLFANQEDYEKIIAELKIIGLPES